MAIDKLIEGLEREIEDANFTNMIEEAINATPYKKSIFDIMWWQILSVVAYASIIALILYSYGETISTHPFFSDGGMEIAISSIVLFAGAIWFIKRRRLHYWSDKYKEMAMSVLKKYDESDPILTDINLEFRTSTADLKHRDNDLRTKASEYGQDIYLYSTKRKSVSNKVAKAANLASLLLTGNGSMIVNKWLTSNAKGTLNYKDYKLNWTNFQQVLLVRQEVNIKTKRGNTRIAKHSRKESFGGITIEFQSNKAAQTGSFMLVEEEDLIIAPKGSSNKVANAFEDMTFNQQFSIYNLGMTEIQLFRKVDAKAMDKFVTSINKYPSFIFTSLDDGRCFISLIWYKDGEVPFMLDTKCNFGKNFEQKVNELKLDVFMIISIKRLMQQLESLDLI